MFAEPAPPVMRATCGHVVDLDPRRWFDAPSPADDAVLDAVRGPVIDVGCGPGRLLAGLAARGVDGLGVDVSATAVAHARSLGVDAVQASVFSGTIPGAGGFRTAMLLDGNVGIGGDPARLLARCGELLAPEGAVVVEVERPGVPLQRMSVRFESSSGADSPWFPWARVGATAIAPVAEAAGFGSLRTESHGERWFAWLRR